MCCPQTRKHLLLGDVWEGSYSLDCFSLPYSHHTLQFNIVQMGLGWVLFSAGCAQFCSVWVFFRGIKNATSEKKKNQPKNNQTEPEVLNLKALT